MISPQDAHILGNTRQVYQELELQQLETLMREDDTPDPRQYRRAIEQLDWVLEVKEKKGGKR